MISPLQWAVAEADLNPARGAEQRGGASTRLRSFFRAAKQGLIGYLRDPSLRQLVQQAVRDHLDLD